MPAIVYSSKNRAPFVYCVYIVVYGVYKNEYAYRIEFLGVVRLLIAFKSPI